MSSWKLLALLLLNLGGTFSVSANPEDFQMLLDGALQLVTEGEMKPALSELQSLLPQMTRFRGDKHVETLDVKYWLHVVQMMSGDHHSAIKGFNALISDLMKALGLWNERTLDAITCHTLCHFHLEQFEQARKDFESLLDLRIKFNGEKHFETLKIRGWIANTLHSMKNYEEALAIFQEVIPESVQVFGPRHETTLTYMHKRSLCFLHLNQFDEALSSFRELAKIKIELYGPKHPDTIRDRGWVAETFLHFEMWEECVKEYEGIIEDSIEILGSSHLRTLVDLQHSAVCSLRNGDFEKAKKGFETILEFGWELGKIREALSASKWLIETFLKMGLPERAEEIFRNGLEIAEETLGLDHEAVQNFVYSYAIKLLDFGDGVKAKKVLGEVFGTEIGVFEKLDDDDEMVQLIKDIELNGEKADGDARIIYKKNLREL